MTAAHSDVGFLLEAVPEFDISFEKTAPLVVCKKRIGPYSTFGAGLSRLCRGVEQETGTEMLPEKLLPLPTFEGAAVLLKE